VEEAVGVLRKRLLGTRTKAIKANRFSPEIKKGCRQIEHGNPVQEKGLKLEKEKKEMNIDTQCLPKPLSGKQERG